MATSRWFLSDPKAKSRAPLATQNHPLTLHPNSPEKDQQTITSQRKTEAQRQKDVIRQKYWGLGRGSSGATANIWSYKERDSNYRSRGGSLPKQLGQPRGLHLGSLR